MPIATLNTGISIEGRKAVANGLSNVLADTFCLYEKTHGFHWNVTGPMFQTLHLMFMEQYTDLWNSIDVIAERIRALGEYAPFGGDAMKKLTIISDSPLHLRAMEMVNELMKGHESVCRTVRVTLNLAEEAEDHPTIDLLTERLLVHEKTAWMLRSLLEEEDVEAVQ